MKKANCRRRIGVWWVHLCVLALGLYLVFRESSLGMNTLDRYLYRTVLVYAFMALAVLVTLGALFLFISQQSDVGVGNYSAGEALDVHVLQSSGAGVRTAADRGDDRRVDGIGQPRGGQRTGRNARVGSIGLAHHMAGGSRRPHAWRLRCTASANTSRRRWRSSAKREKTTSKLADISFAGSSGAWVKDGNLILRVQTGEVDQAFGGVSLFELDGANKLLSVKHAERISVADPAVGVCTTCRPRASVTGISTARRRRRSP